MSNLDRAIQVALEAHSGQIDKAGKPYILHPLRLMFSFQSEDEMIAAVLHDVVEDSDYTIEDIRSFGFSGVVLEALDCLTKRENESYEDFILRILKSDLARKIKLADIKDNMDLARLYQVTEADLKRLEKYHRAFRVLLKGRSDEVG